MIYSGPFFWQFNQQEHHLIEPDDFIKFDRSADTIAIDFYTYDYDQQSEIINHLLNRCTRLFVYNNEAVHNESTNYADFIKANDYEKIIFFSDTILNFNLNHARCLPLVCWFIDHVNYYATANWAKKLLGQLNHTYDRPKMFDCLLGSTKTHRDFIEKLYQTSPYKDQIIFSYFKYRIENGLWDSKYHPSKLGVPLTSNQFKIDDEDARVSAMIPTDIYNNSYYSVVAETISTNEYSHFTEKVAKPIVALRPFVVFAGQHYLRNLKKLGFQTFSSVIDESYDDHANDQTRFKLAWQQVEYLCQQNPRQIIERLQPVLDHNKQHFLMTDWIRPARNLLAY